MFSRVMTSFDISSVIPSLFSPPLNCSVNNLSGSLYLHSGTFVHILPIHSLADSLLFLCSFWYCSVSMIWLWHGLNLLLNTENSAFVVLHFSFSSWVNISMSNRSSWPSLFLITGILSLSFILFLLYSSLQVGNLTVQHTYLVHSSWISAFSAPVLHFFASDFLTGLALWPAGTLFQCLWMLPWLLWQCVELLGLLILLCFLNLPFQFVCNVHAI